MPIFSAAKSCPSESSLASQPKRKKSQLKSIENGLGEVLGAEQLARLADICRLKRRWAEIVGPMLSASTQPITIETGCLLIAVQHSTVAQQIRFLQQEIRDACFKKCRIGGISRLRTRVQPNIAVATPKQKIHPVRVSLQQKKRIVAELGKVEDRKLKRAIFDARVSQLSYQ